MYLFQEKARKFKQHREAHYNEFRALREWRDKRAAKMIGDSEESDDAGDCRDSAMTDVRVQVSALSLELLSVPCVCCCRYLVHATSTCAVRYSF